MAKKGGARKAKHNIYTDGIDPKKVLGLRNLHRDLAVLSTVEDKYAEAAQACGKLVKMVGELVAGDALE